MTCIQAFVCAVPEGNRAAFITHATRAAEAFRDHGCLRAVECWGADVPEGEMTSFRKAVLARDSEAIVAWSVWTSRAAHDAVMQTPPDDPRLTPDTNPMPFDGARLIFGAFEPVLELGTPQQGGFMDVFMAPIPRTRRAEFTSIAEVCDPIFMEHGAVWIVEGWGSDLPAGQQTDFRRAVAAEPQEDVLFSVVQWADRATRDAGNSKIMNDSRLAEHAFPFDGQRLIFGGFVPVVER